MPTAPDPLAEIVDLMQQRLHALEMIVVRAIGELEDVRPGLLGEISGPVIFMDRPDASFDEHLQKVDHHIAHLLIRARQYRGEAD